MTKLFAVSAVSDVC